jgi:predicted membrane channel-forming protein YqfA (hemolysin III family)
MEEDELVIGVLAAIAVLLAGSYIAGGRLHRLYLRNNPAAGLPRLAVLASLGWLGIVLKWFADPSIVGIYVVFYGVLGLAATLSIGLLVPKIYGIRLRVDVYERRNMAAALVLASHTLSVGLIFGGCLWGEADPDGDGEGGWWIPLGFFAAGLAVLWLAAAFYIKHEPGSLRLRLIQDRSWPAARAAATYLVSVAIVLTDAVAGDFWGWTHGMLALVMIAVMIAAHRLLNRGLPQVLTTVEQRTDGWFAGRQLEAVLYALMALAFWLLQRLLDGWLLAPWQAGGSP